MPFIRENIIFHASCKGLPCKTVTSLKTDTAPSGQAEPWHFTPLIEVS